VGSLVVDSSVLVAFLDRNDALHEPAARALEKAWDAEVELLIPSVAYGEAMVRPLRAAGEVLAEAEAFFDTQTIVPIERADAREAARLLGLHRPWLRMPDALVLGVGLRRGATVLTGDARWAAVSESVEVCGG
jgi:predicted nucleic acid-binding protein